MLPRSAPYDPARDEQSQRLAGDSRGCGLVVRRRRAAVTRHEKNRRLGAIATPARPGVRDDADAAQPLFLVWRGLDGNFFLQPTIRSVLERRQLDRPGSRVIDLR